MVYIYFLYNIEQSAFSTQNPYMSVTYRELCQPRNRKPFSRLDFSEGKGKEMLIRRTKSETQIRFLSRAVTPRFCRARGDVICVEIRMENGSWMLSINRVMNEVDAEENLRTNKNNNILYSYYNK